MMRLLRHRYLRRLVTLPALFGLFFVFVTTLPLWAIGAAAVSPRLPGKWRPLRLLWVVAVYLVLQVAGVIVVGALWIASGFGRNFAAPGFRAAHYRVLGVLLSVLMRAMQWAFKLRLDLTTPPLPEDQPQIHRGSRPLLVLCRHAGFGDSFLIVHELMSVYGRRPRIVLKDTLQWDPLFDLLLNRLPTRFIVSAPGAGATVAGLVGDLAGDLTADDALVIFPEGGNFTERRRQRGIDRLETAGRTVYAERARAMPHVMPPRPAGAFAAIDAAQDADVMFVAHTGLEQLTTLRDLWRGLPMNADVRGQFWVVPAENVPDDPGERMDWLYRAWERMDDWIAENR
jgi:1-acyl-sn-glycerol-3-phosphate acyltransferase